VSGSQLEDLRDEVHRYYGLQRGVVTSITDPKGLHRVQAIIPGIVEPNTDWLYPLTMGGGSPQRGGHVVPAVGSDVAIWFHQGDPQGAGAYAAAHWGLPTAGTEIPGDVNDVGTQNPELVQSIEFPDATVANGGSGGTLRITVDERPGSRSLQILDLDVNKQVQSVILLDRENRAIMLQAVSQIILKCTGAIVLQGLEVQINGRRVQTSSAMI
jgi:hypothetical protein